MQRCNARLPRGRLAPALVLDALLAATALGWGIAFAVRAPGPVGFAVLGLHATVAGLFAGRRASRAEPRRRDVLAVAPALVAGLFAGALAPPPTEWSVVPSVLFVAGAVIAAVGLAGLGRSFAVLPADRGLVQSGLHAVVRHPVYLGEIVMVGAAALANGSLLAAAVACAALWAMVVRIRVEEDVLGQGDGFAAYRGRVRFRLLPGVW